MGSVINYFTCECGGVRYNDYNYRSGEESDFCVKCGKRQEAFRYTDENGEIVFKEGVTADGEPFKYLDLKIEKGGGYGTAAIRTKDSMAQALFSFDSKEDVLTFKEDIETQIQNNEIEVVLDNSYIYLHDPNTNTGEVIFGESKPHEETFEDCEPEPKTEVEASTTSGGQPSNELELDDAVLPF